MSYPNLSAQLEAIIYLAKEPIAIDAIHKALPEVDRESLERAIQLLIEKYQMENHGIEIREVAGGLRFSTKPEHHEVLRKFLQSQNPPTRLSLAALETLAVIAYKQPVTVPEIQEIRGVQASGVIKTLLDKKLVAAGGRKEVLGRPILYKTTRDFWSLWLEAHQRASKHGRVRGTDPDSGLLGRDPARGNSTRRAAVTYTA
jgi:segregation and condensation protein B